jgi:CheY-like chemotaxis protein
MRVRVVHFRPEEAEPLLAACRAGGFSVEFEPGGYTVMTRAIRTSPPDVVLIDLSRLPSHGREVACWLRNTKYARHIPLVFVGGEPAKMDGIRKLIPDAVFTSVKGAAVGIKRAAERANVSLVVPPSSMERYSNRTTAQKLGIKEEMTVAVFNAPRDYVNALGPLPRDVELVEDPEEVQALTLWFVREPREYRAAIGAMRRIAGRTKLWVIWHKATAGGSLTDKMVREFANEVGLVDYKICAVDKRWSGMALAVKKK